MNEVTQLLSALERGDPHAASRLLPRGYEELRKLAVQRMAWSGTVRILDRRRARRVAWASRLL